MSTSGFLYRDILKYVLPVAIMLLLFIPFINSDFEVNSIGLIAIVLSFVLGCLIEHISTYIKYIFLSIKKTSEIGNWMSENWNYDKVFYYLDKDERDYLYLTAAYIVFCRNVIFILLTYSITIVIHIIVNCQFDIKSIFLYEIPFINDSTLNSWLIMILCCSIIYVLVKSLISEIEYLYYPNGQYDFFAEKTQKKENCLLVKNIYGFVIINKVKWMELNKNVEVEILFKNKFIGRIKINEYMYWNFPLSKENLNKKLTINFYNNSFLLKSLEYIIKDLNKPYIEIEIN